MKKIKRVKKGSDGDPSLEESLKKEKLLNTMKHSHQ